MSKLIQCTVEELRKCPAINYVQSCYYECFCSEFNLLLTPESCGKDKSFVEYHIQFTDKQMTCYSCVSCNCSDLNWKTSCGEDEVVTERLAFQCPDCTTTLDCVKCGPKTPINPRDPGGPCFNSFDPCCGSNDENCCLGSQDPCCGNNSYECNSCADSPDANCNPCAANPDYCDPCRGSGDPCCNSDDPCCNSADLCCNSTDPCCGSTDPCCGSTDPCCPDYDPCCTNPSDPACDCNLYHTGCCECPTCCGCAGGTDYNCDITWCVENPALCENIDWPGL